MKTNKYFALMGFVGGLLFVVGDGLFYWYAGNNSNGIDVDPLWAGLPEWRFVLSYVLGFAGMILMLPAFVSFYKMIAATCGRVLRLFTAFMGVGVSATGFLHFSIGALPPITYKAVLDAGGTAAMATAVSQHWIDVVMPVNLCLILFLCFEYIVHFAATASGKLGLPRITCLLGIVGAAIVGVAWKLIFSGTSAEGAYNGFESLGEALIFLTAFLYWRKMESDGSVHSF